MAVDLSNYVEVNERVAAFHAKYPDGSLQSSWKVTEIGGDILLVAEARAYRTPEDKRPGVGTASEPFPGKTPYTKDSELMNAETSAWGRALAALGFEVTRGIASREEVRNREGNGDARPVVQEIDDAPASEKQRSYLLGTGNRKGLIDKAPISDAARVKVTTWAQNMSKSAASRLIEAIKEDPEKGADLAAQMAGFSDVPLEEEADPEDHAGYEGDGAETEEGLPFK